MTIAAPNFVKLALLSLSTTALSNTALGQVSPAPTELWAVGMGAAVFDSPYAGEDTRVRAFPLFSHEGEHVFLQGISGGVHLYQSQWFTFDALLSARLHGFDIDDLGSEELLANGVDASLLSDRDDGLDAGFRAAFQSALGTISLEAVHDIANASDGYELSLDYRYRWLFNRTALTFNAGASQLSSELAGYYFGILDEEVARGVIAYAPGSAVVSRVGLAVMQPLGSTKWQLLGSLEYQFLPGELRDSPLLEPDQDGFGRLVVGLGRRF